MEEIRTHQQSNLMPYQEISHNGMDPTMARPNCHTVGTPPQPWAVQSKGNFRFITVLVLIVLSMNESIEQFYTQTHSNYPLVHTWAGVFSFLIERDRAKYNFKQPLYNTIQFAKYPWTSYYISLLFFNNYILAHVNIRNR